ncbi:ABC transporter ATP-binding protein [Acuticoccus sp. I52.16.1]|uniref:ABC transporter ATP-binding protein n=1 Tax=Acuticoccus sp. I52.16.1 TaxID=2928472 RepID=UPI001FD330E8|nr:ABC transporter ATP-binding protein [Acuticoccus sp. I52.16.1]UOM34273.1 ABC transporter ATP-binding protein [Acuticoccus sp. I52.16.1]
MDTILSVEGLSKTYASGQTALKNVSLDIRRGEILALLGPNGAGKTTLISVICGLVTPTAGRVTVDGADIIADYRKARSLIGLVPQEVALEPFEKVEHDVAFSRGLFGKANDPAYLEKLLRTLSLWDKRKSPIMQLSGGMKRRVLIAKALAHEPRILFLDEPTAGVDVELRKDMWATVRELQRQGVTIILTTHYIEEAEAIAERVGIISGGELLLVEEKDQLMSRMGRRELTLSLAEPLARIPDSLARYDLALGADGRSVVWGQCGGDVPVAALMADAAAAGLTVADVATAQRSLEDIFVELVSGDASSHPAREAAE